MILTTRGSSLSVFPSYILEPISSIFDFAFSSPSNIGGGWVVFHVVYKNILKPMFSDFMGVANELMTAATVTLENPWLVP